MAIIILFFINDKWNFKKVKHLDSKLIFFLFYLPAIAPLLASAGKGVSGTTRLGVGSRSPDRQCPGAGKPE